MATTASGDLRADFGTNRVTTERSSQPFSLAYSAVSGTWAVTGNDPSGIFTWQFTNAPAVAQLSVLVVQTNGTARHLQWTLQNPAPSALYRFYLSGSSERLLVDLGGDGTVESAIDATGATVNELPPTLVAVEQDLT